jgi:hypothetical protein
MTAQYDAAGAVAAGTMYWAYDKGGGYSILDENGAERPALVESIVRPYPMLVAGDPVSYAFDAATSTFTATYVPSPAITAPTEISVPPRLYPNGYRVACGDCEHTVAGATLLITRPPSTSPATITLMP